MSNGLKYSIIYDRLSRKRKRISKPKNIVDEPESTLYCVSGLDPSFMDKLAGEFQVRDFGEIECLSDFGTLKLCLVKFRTGVWYYEVELITDGIIQVSLLVRVDWMV